MEAPARIGMLPALTDQGEEPNETRGLGDNDLFLTSNVNSVRPICGRRLDDRSSGAPPDGRIITLTLKSDGSKLTGTIYGIRPIPLEGSIEGNALKIKLKVTQGRRTPLKLHRNPGRR